MTKEVTSKVIEVLLPKVFEHPVLYPILLMMTALGVALLPPLILMYTNKKLVKADLTTSIAEMFKPFTDEFNLLKTSFEVYKVEQGESNKRNESQHSLVLFSLQELNDKVSSIESPELLEAEMSRSIQKGLGFIQNKKLRIDCTEYLTLIKSILVENFKHHKTTGFSELNPNDHDYQIGIENAKRKFTLIFGEEHALSYYCDISHYRRFLESIERIASLNANSKKERYVVAMKAVLNEIIAKLVDYSIRKILIEEKYSPK